MSTSLGAEEGGRDRKAKEEAKEKEKAKPTSIEGLTLREAMQVAQTKTNPHN
jgi:hypothetical protein